MREGEIETGISQYVRVKERERDREREGSALVGHFVSFLAEEIARDPACV